jgi:hypothetical protein
MVPFPSELPVSESFSEYLAAWRPIDEAAAASSLKRIAKVMDSRMQNRRFRPFLFAAASRLLTMIGLPQRQRVIALKRIENARKYAIDDEFGAAMFEMRQFEKLVSHSMH